MIQTILTLPVLKKLLEDSGLERQEMIKIYDRLPQTRCQRRTRCCSLLPEMTLLEAMQIIQKMVHEPSLLREIQIKKMIRYFFTNSLEITACPFLLGQDCSIYPDRVFGCRAYGLWSLRYYQGLVEKNSQAKAVIHQQWRDMGLTLPKEVLLFKQPYCQFVEIESSLTSFDEMLISASDDIEILSQTFNPWHRYFMEYCFSDMSFFLAGLILGPTKAVRLKFMIALEIVKAGNWNLLEEVLNVIFDPFE
jgi:hypothetical protein